MFPLNIGYWYDCLSAFALDLLGFDVYTFPPGAAGAMSFHDPFEGTEISDIFY
jgi:hypothetical protein